MISLCACDDVSNVISLDDGRFLSSDLISQDQPLADVHYPSLSLEIEWVLQP